MHFAQGLSGTGRRDKELHQKCLGNGRFGPAGFLRKGGHK
jgi:hypothetical protein